MDWPIAPTFLSETSRLLRAIYHRWKCYLYRSSFDQTSRNRMREKVTASIIFKDRKASYPRRYTHIHWLVVLWKEYFVIFAHSYLVWLILSLVTTFV